MSRQNYGYRLLLLMLLICSPAYAVDQNADQIYIEAHDLPEGLPELLKQVPSVKPLAKLQAFQIANQYPVYLQLLNTGPMISVSVIYGVGSRDDWVKTEVISRMLDKGAGDYDHYALAQQLSLNGMQLDITAGTHFTTIRYRVPKAKLLNAVKLVNLMMRYPRFTQSGLDDAVKELKLQVKVQQYSAPYLARILWERLVFGEQHLWTSRWMDKKMLDQLGTDALKAYYQKQFLSTAPVMSVVGDITQAELEPLLKHGFTDWPDSSRALQTVKIDLPFAAKPHREKTLHLIDVPKSQQVELRAGIATVSLLHPDWPALFVLADILGGSNGRLYNDLREKRGLSYSIYSRQSKHENVDGYFSISGSTQDYKLPAFIQGINTHCLQLAGTLSEAELEQTKSKLLGAYRIRKNDTDFVHLLLDDFIKTGKPMDIDETLYAKIAKLSLRDVKVVAEKYQAAPFYWVMAGDADKIKKIIKPKLPEFSIVEYDRELE